MSPILIVIVTLIIGLPVYFLPSIIAKKRKSPNFNTVLVLNIFFGWTLFGWVIALLRAMSNYQRTIVYTKNK